MSVITLWKVNIILLGKKLYESILILPKVWLILLVIPLSYLYDIQSYHKFYQAIHDQINQIILDV